MKKINESGIISQLNRHLAGEIERKCYLITMDNVDNRHSFDDNNGTHHRIGYIVTCEDEDERNITFARLIKELILTRGVGCDLNDVDTSNITNMSCVFSDSEFRGDISGWDTSSVKDMSFMLEECPNFNCDLSKWNTSSVQTMKRMFSCCTYFKGIGIGNWNISRVKDFSFMFNSCQNFDSNLTKWGRKFLRNDISMSHMFCNCTNFKGEGLNMWFVQNVTSVKNMFFNCKYLEATLSSWHFSKIPIDISSMFNGSAIETEEKYPKWFKKY